MRSRKRLTAKSYYKGIANGDAAVLSRAITLIESRLPEDERLAQEVISMCLPNAGGAFRIGVTGSPGSGKSTFIEAFGLRLISAGKRPGVLAVDPSSQRTRGSILGDKTRMPELSTRPEAFVRPSPSGADSGGVNRRTRETILLLETAGYDPIIVETVGVGQAETRVYDMVDFFLALALAGAGDELQGIKRGVIELADTIIITKADGENLPRARAAKSEYARAISLFPSVREDWKPRVLLTSALEGTGLSELADVLQEFYTSRKASGALADERKRQASQWFHTALKSSLLDYFWQKPDSGSRHSRA